MAIKVLGYSLIELMVVIGIVGLISTIGISSYRSYMIKARSSEVITVLDQLMKESILYAERHGRFANAYDLGYSDTVDSEYVDNPEELLPAKYFVTEENVILLEDTSDDAPCGAIASLGISVDANAIGIPNVAAGTAMAFVAVAFHNGREIKKYYYYYIFSDGYPVFGDFVSGINSLYTDEITPDPGFMAFVEEANTDAVCQ